MSKPHRPPASLAKPSTQLYGVKLQHGPLPPPEELAAYEQAYPGTAERIIIMAEKDQQAELGDIRFSQLARFVVDLLGQLFLYGLVIAAVYLAINDKPLEAFFAGLAPIAVAIYANTRKQPHDNQ